ncbi:MAG: large conductance mechanosensitive channel protein MscL [Actinobacteria bacterium]|nr:MAG: large conductance mechanosensitive channel protein MscL [Actinomycetota bacterium]
MKEFRDFLLRGNIVELAVAFVLGVAFGALITSFVDNLLMPIVAMIIGKPDFRGLTFTINEAVFRYGSFLTDLLAFVAVAAAVFFFVVKPVNALMNRLRSPVEEGMPDEERRHQELLAALGQIRASSG